MTTAIVTSPASLAGSIRYIEWGPVLAGAFGTAAILLVLLTFGSAIGLSAVSTWPNTGLSATTLAIIGALWTLIVHIFAFGTGGYICGRLRTEWTDTTLTERHFRDGAHGFVVWAVAIVLGALLAASTAAGIGKVTAQAGAAVGGGAAAAAAATIDPRDVGVDLLMRDGPVPAAGAAPAAAGPAAPTAAAPDERNALMRVMGATLKEGTLQPRDRTWLAQVVARRTGLPQAEAEKRVDEAVAEAKAAEVKMREAADKARKTTALAAFLAAATFAAACAAACYGAGRGGRDRDERKVFSVFGRERLW